MKKPALLFTLKCAVILYFAACTNIDKLTASGSVTQSVTDGDWKVNFYTDADNNKTNSFSGYDINFRNDGKLIIYKNGTTSEGNWHEDNISKTLILDINSNDQVLHQLNQSWTITRVSDNTLAFENTNSHGNESLAITKK